MKHSRFIWPLLVLVITIPTFWSILRTGYFPMHDDMQATRIYDMVKCLKDMQIPCRWVPDMGYRYGYPQFNFYGPLPYYFMSLFNLLGVGLFDSVKIGFIAPLILGNLAMFYAGSLLFGTSAGFIATILYAYSPYRGSDIYSRGAMGETWAFVFLPLVLLAVKKLIDKTDLRHSAFLALSLGGLLMTHNISTLIFIPLVAIYGIFLVFQKSKIKFKSIFLNTKPFIISGLWGIALSATFFLPVLFETKYAHTESMLGGYFDYRAHFVSLKQLFLTSFWSFGSSEIGPTDDLSFFFSPIMILAVIASLVVIFIRLLKRKIGTGEVTAIIFCVIGLASTFMVHEKSSFIWSLIPPLAYLQFPWRFLVTANFFFALAGSYIFSQFNLEKSKYLLISIFLLTFLFSASYYKPKSWLNITEYEKYSGYLWDKQMTISIFDYLPTSAQTPPIHPAPVLPLSSTRNYSLTNFQKGTNWIAFDYSSTEDSTVTINILDFPGWKFFDNDNKIEHANNVDGVITIQLSPGDHHIKGRLTDTPIRLLGNLTTLITLPLALYLALRKNTHVS